MLIRPDGFIGFRAVPADPAGLDALADHLVTYLIEGRVLMTNCLPPVLGGAAASQAYVARHAARPRQHHAGPSRRDALALALTGLRGGPSARGAGRAPRGRCHARLSAERSRRARPAMSVSWLEHMSQFESDHGSEARVGRRLYGGGTRWQVWNFACRAKLWLASYQVIDLCPGDKSAPTSTHRAIPQLAPSTRD